ncbi:NlpC/P60 family protein [Mesorhizobium sp. B2-6-6]|nr:NlpC/P60 family protein [Mesorhizobium sp. B2-6-6]
MTAARSGVGGEYKWGSAEFKSWDASGLVAWVYQDQGVQVPRTAPWTVGTRTESPQPGDLVAQDWNPDRNRWEHVGVYVGQGRMVSAVNESTGTREHPVTQTGSDPVYFDILGGQ